MHCMPYRDTYAYKGASYCTEQHVRIYFNITPLHIIYMCNVQHARILLILLLVKKYAYLHDTYVCIHVDMYVNVHHTALNNLLYTISILLHYTYMYIVQHA